MGSTDQTKPSSFRKGAWSKEEDELLRKCIEIYGEGKWSSVPRRAGLMRCRKSCRLRWLNYLNPGIRRGKFDHDEVDLIIRLHKLLGNRWSLIAGRIPGRTANDIKNFWNSHLSKKLDAQHEMIQVEEASDAKIDVGSDIIRPNPRRLMPLINIQENKSKKIITDVKPLCQEVFMNNPELPVINTVKVHDEQWLNNNDLISGDHHREEEVDAAIMHDTETILNSQDLQFLYDAEEMVLHEIMDEELLMGGIREWEKLVQGTL